MRISWLGKVERMGSRKFVLDFSGRPEGKRSLGRLRCRRENIKRVLKEKG
jgi:hypothetical protein